MPDRLPERSFTSAASWVKRFGPVERQNLEQRRFSGYFFLFCLTKIELFPGMKLSKTMEFYLQDVGIWRETEGNAPLHLLSSSD